MKELERISGRSHLREESLRKWKEVVPCILAQAELEKRNKGVHSAFEVCESESAIALSK